jgi:prophage tail gpP-like protein
MSKPHKVVAGDTLGSIALRYMGGSARWTEVATANPQLAGRRTAADGSPLIYAGDTLVIPSDQTNAPTKLPAKTVTVGAGDADVSIAINSVKFTGWTGYEITLSYDSFDTFSFSAPFDVSLRELRDAVAPFAFAPCEVYYADALLFKGVLLTPDPELTDKADEITLRGYPLCGVLNDCCVPPSAYPLACHGINLKGIADAACSPYNIPIVFEAAYGADFTEVSIEPTDKILDFLSKLAKERGLLFTNNAKGQLVFFKPRPEKPFVTFTEGEPPLLAVKAKFKAQDFYSHVTGFSKAAGNYPAYSFTFENKILTKHGVLRHIGVSFDDAEDATGVEAATKAYAGRMFADAVSYELECEGHTSAKGELFHKGMTVRLQAPSALLARDTDFTAREVKLICSTEGKKTALTLALPGSWTGEIPEALPWE